MKTKRVWRVIIAAITAGIIVGCNNAFQPATPTPTITASATPTQTVTPTQTFTPIPSETPTLTPDPNIAPTLVSIPVQFIYHGDRTKPYVALTFDLCQTLDAPAGFDANIVNTLIQYNVPATFFMGGDWMRTHPDETVFLAGVPNFELGNHSWDHPDMRTLTDAEMNSEIVDTQDMLYKSTGRISHLFRLPFGDSNEHVLDIIAQHGLYTIQWDVETGDPDPNFDAATINKAVQQSVQNGSIIIMHANGRGWHTAEALPQVIEYLREQGFIPVTVSQLLGLEPLP
jgi:peptidoglycan/xylan/chitin deacetylase (PgdA/CDA1 family)